MGRRDGVFNDATGELCFASSPHRTDTFATSTDITQLPVTTLHIVGPSAIPTSYFALSLCVLFELSLFFYVLGLRQSPLSHSIVYEAGP